MDSSIPIHPFSSTKDFFRVAKCPINMFCFQNFLEIMREYNIIMAKTMANNHWLREKNSIFKGYRYVHMLLLLFVFFYFVLILPGYSTDMLLITVRTNIQDQPHNLQDLVQMKMLDPPPPSKSRGKIYG